MERKPKNECMCNPLNKFRKWSIAQNLLKEVICESFSINSKKCMHLITDFLNNFKLLNYLPNINWKKFKFAKT